MNNVFFSVAYLFASGYRYLRSMVVAFSRHLIPKKNTGLAFGIIETVSAAGITLAPITAGFITTLNPRLLYPISFILLLFILPLSIYSLRIIKKKSISIK